jgi:hypothetical protein
MKLFDLRDNRYNLTELFRIENFTTVEEVIEKLNMWFEIEIEDECDSFYTSDVNGKDYKYVYVANDGSCRFVESLTEFSKGFQSEENWRVKYSVEVCEE